MNGSSAYVHLGCYVCGHYNKSSKTDNTKPDKLCGVHKTTYDTEGCPPGSECMVGRLPYDVTHCYVILFSHLSPLYTNSTSLWASLHHTFPVLSVFSHVSYHFIFCSFLPRCCRAIYASRPPHLIFSGTTMSIIILEKFSYSPLLLCPYKCILFCLRNFDIWHTLVSSCMTWFQTWSFLVLPLVFRNILTFAARNLFLSFVMAV